MLKYDNGFKHSNIIGSHDKQIKDIILSQLQDDDIFIDTTWIHYDNNLRKILNSIKGQNKRLVCYSGPDWNNTFCPPGEKHNAEFIWKELNNHNILHIGNTLGPHYFSWWVDFVYTNLDKFEQFDPYDLQTPLKHFMCLNRKPHRPRIELVNNLEIYNLIDYGYVSLGESDFRLSKDIISADGDQAVNGNIDITNDICSLGHIDNWNNHFVNVVTETTVYTDVFITEKLLKPIIGRRPFMILGDNNIYKVLQDWGFDTFDDLFGDGWKNPDYSKRMDWIIDNLKDLVKQDKLDELLLELKPRLENNYNTFLKFAKINRNNLEHLLDK